MQRLRRRISLGDLQHLVHLLEELAFAAPASCGALRERVSGSGCGLFDHGNREGEPVAQAGALALGPDAAPWASSTIPLKMAGP